MLKNKYNDDVKDRITDEMNNIYNNNIKRINTYINNLK